MLNIIRCCHRKVRNMCAQKSLKLHSSFTFNSIYVMIYIYTCIILYMCMHVCVCIYILIGGPGPHSTIIGGQYPHNPHIQPPMATNFPLFLLHCTSTKEIQEYLDNDMHIICIKIIKHPTVLMHTSKLKDEQDNRNIVVYREKIVYMLALIMICKSSKLNGPSQGSDI